MRELIFIRQSDGAKFEFVQTGYCEWQILRHREDRTELAWFSNMAIYGQDKFDSLVHAYQYLKTWQEELY